MTEQNYQRWAELVDREAVGEVLSPEEKAFCQRFQKQDAACQRELGLWLELEDLQAEPGDGTRSLVNAALAALDSEATETDDDMVDERALKSRKHYLATFSAATAALAACAALGWVGLQYTGGPEPQAAVERAPARVELVFASGEVRVRNRPVRVGDLLLAQGDQVEVLRGAACLAIDPGIDLCLADHSRLRIAQVGAAGQQVELLSGRVTASLDKQPRGASFSVLARESRVTAVGTAFSVEVKAGEQEVETVVLSGEVSVSGKQGKRLLHAHQKAVMRNSRARVETVMRADESRHWALVRHADLWKGPATSVLDLSRAPGGTEVVLNGRLIGVAPLSSLIPAGNHRLELRLQGGGLLERPLVVEAGKAALNEIDLTHLFESQSSALVPEPESEPAPAQVQTRMAGSAESGKATAAGLIGVARRFMQQGRWAEAAFAYREVQNAYPDSPEARTVLVPLGQLELDHLSRPPIARKLFELYLSGGGPLTQEASFSLIRALRQMGHKQQERQAVAAFLKMYPDSFEAPALRQRLLELGGGSPDQESERTDEAR